MESMSSIMASMLAPRAVAGHAVQRAQAPYKVHAVDADHFAARKYLGQNVQRHAVVGVVESRNQNQIVGNIKLA